MTESSTAPLRQRINAEAKFPLMLLFCLYLAQGLPVGFMTQALPALLRHYGVSLTEIGFSGLLMLPWAIKFLWAPVIDHSASIRFGHYRLWIISAQIAMLGCVLLLACLPVDQLQQRASLWWLFILLLCMNFFCATQDNASDGLAVKILRHSHVHWGNSFQVIGSRLGYIFGGGAVLYAIASLSWAQTFFALAILLLLNSILIFIYQEPAAQPRQRSSRPLTWSAIKRHYFSLWHSADQRLWLWVLLSYKCADGLLGPVLKPMMIDMGLSLKQVGVYVTILGAVFALLGAWAANYLIARWGMAKMLLCFTLLQSLSWIYYWQLAWCFEQHIPFARWHLYLANILEESISAMALVALLSLIMQHARRDYAATDFSLQVALMTMVSGVLYLIAGKVADSLGYSNMLLLVLLLSVLCFVPKYLWYQRTQTGGCN